MNTPQYDLDTSDMPELRSWNVVHMFRGSVAHGMYRPSSEPNSIDDIDTIAVCIPPIDYYFGLKEYGSRGTREIKHGQYDTVVYECKKFVYLLSQGNPNVLSVLWTPPKYWLHVSAAWGTLYRNRNVFIGKHVYDSFAGYAAGQLYKMEHQKFEGYMGEKRKALVNEHGYDTKNAAHCIRLLRMASEFFRFGWLQVDRSGIDAQELLDIKDGALTLDEVKTMAEALFKSVKEDRDRSSMRDHPDKEGVNEVCVNMVRAMYDDYIDI